MNDLLQNLIHTTIKLKATTSYTNIDFLDVATFKGPNFSETKKLDTKVYFKPTDSHALLHMSSFHPKHTFRGILKSQLIRFRRICSNRDDCDTATKTLFSALQKRGYSRSFLRTVKKEVLQTPHTPPVQRDKNMKIVPFITLFSSSTVQALKTIKSNYNRLMTGTQLEHFKIISAHRRNPNLKDLLVRAKLPQPRKPPRSPGRNRTATNPTTKHTFPVPRDITLKHTNCVYMIECRSCGKTYVGETRNTLSSRLSTHRYNIKNNKKSDTYLTQHSHKNLRLQGLQHNPDWTTEERRKTERRWIWRLRTLHPHGLNKSYFRN